MTRLFKVSEDPSPVISLGVRWWYGDHDPQASENVVGGALEKYDNYVNTANGKLWLLLNPTPGNLEWIPLGNTAALLNLPREYSSVALAFNEERTPNALHDTFVSAQFLIEAENGSPIEISAQVEFSNEFKEIATKSFSTANPYTAVDSFSFIVPAGSAYKIVVIQAVSPESDEEYAILNSVNELTL